MIEKQTISNIFLLPVLGLIAGVGSGFLLLHDGTLPVWVTIVLAILLALVAWWQTGCINTHLVGASPAGDSLVTTTTTAARESPARQAPTRTRCWKYWLVRLGVFLLAVMVGITGQVAWWWAQDDQPWWRLGFVPLPTMVEIPAGEFQMGSENGDSDEKPIHTVTIKQPFRMSQHEITFAEYDYYVWLMKQNEVEFSDDKVEFPDDEKWGRDTRPVINVSWDDAQGYVNWLSKETGESCRLPTEAEWEYAARAGTTTDYFWGDDVGKNNANCADCGSEWDRKQTAPVGSFKPNQWGLQDMHGNVWEWTQDCWHDNYTDAPKDSTAWESNGDCGRRVVRGGAWYYYSSDLYSSGRFDLERDYRDSIIGFRVVCGLPLPVR
ncbi:formylglycine-generating enzyme family protein [Thiothrix winogradskyi]|uniref:Formylglycine-generating enzyme family protein n=1 Tax=Thiothrix winogradskyi TaxID=96472 RepID=A0ABY3SXU5_9GAMM|nr:formylglycine-generating enzyme family protein [Thiothrix winogradskyi]UJS23727.1 formylglycine-generating enzyme family protein [Thiothrix winogradskyi]